MFSVYFVIVRVIPISFAWDYGQIIGWSDRVSQFEIAIACNFEMFFQFAVTGVFKAAGARCFLVTV